MASNIIFMSISTIIIFSPFVLIGGNIVPIACFQLLVLFCLGFYFFKGEKDCLVFKRTFLDYYIFIYFILACFSFILSQNPYNTRNELFNLGSYIIIFYLILFIIDELKPQNTWLQVKNLINLIISVGVIISSIGIIQFIKGETVKATMMNPNILAGYLIMIIPLVISNLISIFKKYRFPELYSSLSSLKFPKKNRKDFLSLISNDLVAISYLISLGLMVICLVVTFSLGAWIGLSFGIGLFLFLGLKIDFDKKCRYTIIGGVCILTYLIIYKFIYQNIVFNRLNWWRGACKMIFDYPFTGVGLGCFGNVYLKYKTGFLNSLYVHNYFLQIAAEIGIMGVLVFLYLLIVFFKRGIKQILNYNSINNNKSVLNSPQQIKTQWINKQEIFFNIGILSSLAAILVQNIFDYNLYLPANAILFWVLLGLSCSLQNNFNYGKVCLKSASKWWWKIVLMVFVGNLVIIIGKPVLASRYYVLGESSLKDKEFKEAEILFKKAMELNPLWPYTYWGLAKSYLNCDRQKIDKSLLMSLQRNDEESGRSLIIPDKKVQLKLAEAIIELNTAIRYDKCNAFF